MRHIGRRAARGPIAGVLVLVVMAVAVGVATPATAVVPSPCGASGVLSGTGPLTCTYSVVGSDTFTVPSAVTQANLVAIGGKGGNYFIDGPPITGRPGGPGGQATGTLALTPGQVLQVDVAGRGVNGTGQFRTGGMGNGPRGGTGALGGFGGSNGGVAGAAGDASGANGGTAASNGGNGSGGGGSSDIRIGPSGCGALTCDLSTRVLVAAGGGGGGGSGGSGNALGGAGGAGGGSNGGDGGASVDGGNAATSGFGATQAAGGAPGINPPRHVAGQDQSDPRLGGDGFNGALGVGGLGGAGNAPLPPATTSGGGAGGGGGGGYFGGGGGGGGGGPFGGGGGAGGGAGGGSGFLTPAAITGALTPGVNNDTINAGNGQVTITWTVPQAPPTVSTEAASGVTDTGASLPGTVNPNGADATYTFEYGPTLSFGSITTPDDAGLGSSPVSVSASVTGLSANTTYYYRLVASNSAGATLGTVRSFRTTGTAQVPVAVTGAASAITSTGATLAGQVNPQGSQTAYTFEYGTSTAFGSITPVVALDDADGLEAVSDTLSGLAAGTTYFYRVVASNATGTTLGAVMAFTTAGGALAPLATTGAATSVTATGATLAGTVDPRGAQTTYTFEYGPTNAFGSITAVAGAGSAPGSQSVSLPVSGLAPATQYRYRIVATNANGTVAGTVGSFTTGSGA